MAARSDGHRETGNKQHNLAKIKRSVVGWPRFFLHRDATSVKFSNPRHLRSFQTRKLRKNGLGGVAFNRTFWD